MSSSDDDDEVEERTSEHEDEELERAAAGVLGAVYARLGDDERALRYSEQVEPRRAMSTVSVVEMCETRAAGEVPRAGSAPPCPGWAAARGPPRRWCARLVFSVRMRRARNVAK